MRAFLYLVIACGACGVLRGVVLPQAQKKEQTAPFRNDTFLS